MKTMAGLMIATGILAGSGAVHAANTPCSGKKGGVSHCLGSYFVCNDGSTSQSKKTCTSAYVEDGGGAEDGGGSRKSRRR